MGWSLIESNKFKVLEIGCFEESDGLYLIIIVQDEEVEFLIDIGVKIIILSEDFVYRLILEEILCIKEIDKYFMIVIVLLFLEKLY